MARPQIPIEPDEVFKLAALGCKVEEIADFFDCSADTINRRFAPELTKGRADLRKSLRRWQLDAARKGNVTMLIWLGKQMLGQKDKSEDEIDAIRGIQASQLKKEDLLGVISIAMGGKKSDDKNEGAGVSQGNTEGAVSQHEGREAG